MNMILITFFIFLLCNINFNYCQRFNLTIEIYNPSADETSSDFFMIFDTSYFITNIKLRDDLHDLEFIEKGYYNENEKIFLPFLIESYGNSNRTKIWVHMNHPPEQFETRIVYMLYGGSNKGGVSYLNDLRGYEDVGKYKFPDINSGFVFFSKTIACPIDYERMYTSSGLIRGTNENTFNYGGEFDWGNTQQPSHVHALNIQSLSDSEQYDTVKQVQPHPDCLGNIELSEHGHSHHNWVNGITFDETDEHYNVESLGVYVCIRKEAFVPRNGMVLFDNQDDIPVGDYSLLTGEDGKYIRAVSNDNGNSHKHEHRICKDGSSKDPCRIEKEKLWFDYSQSSNCGGFGACQNHTLNSYVVNSTHSHYSDIDSQYTSHLNIQYDYVDVIVGQVEFTSDYQEVKPGMIIATTEELTPPGYESVEGINFNKNFLKVNSSMFKVNENLPDTLTHSHSIVSDQELPTHDFEEGNEQQYEDYEVGWYNLLSVGVVEGVGSCFIASKNHQHVLLGNLEEVVDAKLYPDNIFLDYHFIKRKSIPNYVVNVLNDEKCRNNYWGTDCNEFNCYGRYKTDMKACGFTERNSYIQNHGDCYSHDKCTCRYDFYGEHCDIWDCFGVSKLSPGVCNGGVCIHGSSSTHACECLPGMHGKNCSEVITTDGKLYLKSKRIVFDYQLLDTFPTNKIPVTNQNGNFECDLIVVDDVKIGIGSKCLLESDELTIYLGDDHYLVDGDFITIKPLDNYYHQSSWVWGTKDIIVNLTLVEESDEKNTVLYVSIGVGSSVLAVVLLLIIIIFLIWVRKRKKQSKFFELKDTPYEKLKVNSKLFEINFGDIKLVDLIGKGGSNFEIFKASWKKKICAVKLYSGGYLNGQKEIDELEKEISLMITLNHPNIIQFFGCSFSPPKLGIVLELAEHGDLHKFYHDMERKEISITFKRILSILSGICLGLEYLHDKNLIHRDIKPENILICKDYEPKICDFGVSRLFKNLLSKKTQRVGTSFFIAPEIVKGGVYDTRADIYSLGIIMFIMIERNFEPFSKLSDELYGIELKIANNPKMRPKFSEETIKSKKWYCDLATQNWDSIPERRQKLSSIIEIIERESAKII